MKKSIPVTRYDLECTAKHAKDGKTEYRGLAVAWIGIGRYFAYFADGKSIEPSEAKAYLEKLK